MRWRSHPWRLHRSALQHAEEEYARHAWNVRRTGRDSGLLRHARDGVLLATGGAFDVIEVGERLGHTAHTLLNYRGEGCPTAVSPVGRWMFYVRTGTVLTAALSGRPDCIRHTSGSAVPAPPSRYGAGRRGGRVRWAVPPDATGWEPGDPDAVQRALVAAIAAHAARPRHRRPWWALVPAR